MYKFCCTCMKKSDLKPIFDVDDNGISHYNKLTSSIAEMNFKEMNNQRLICGECCVNLNTVYNFRQTCLKSKTNLINYISQLQTYSHVSGTTSNSLDVKPEWIVVKKEKESDNEDSDYFKEDNTSKFQAESYEESIQFLASAKEECELEEDVTVDHVNEVAHSDVKAEVEHQTMIEHERYTEFVKIDIEDLLSEVKEEPMSDSDTPQDGSTSREPPEEPIETQPKRHRHKERPYKCDRCEKNFIHKGNLTRHIRNHSGEKPYKCEICKKCFSLKSSFNVHQNVHSGERPYECEICKKTFIYKSNLTEHVKIHSGKKQHECEICKKSFLNKSTLTRHLLIHSSEKPHECEICNKCFNLKSNLAAHMKIHSG